MMTRVKGDNQVTNAWQPIELQRIGNKDTSYEYYCLRNYSNIIYVSAICRWWVKHTVHYLQQLRKLS